MPYTVKQVAGMSGVGVRTLHFYDETDLPRPAHTGANGYRFYEEPQLLSLQQIPFYREPGFGLRQIRELLGRPDFQRADALRAHLPGRRLRLERGESVYVPRTVAHWWASAGEGPATVLEVYQPAGRLEQFFREVGAYGETPLHEVLSVEEMVRLFDAHGMCLLGPGLGAVEGGAAPPAS